MQNFINLIWRNWKSSHCANFLFIVRFICICVFISIRLCLLIEFSSWCRWCRLWQWSFSNLKLLNAFGKTLSWHSFFSLFLFTQFAFSIFIWQQWQIFDNIYSVKITVEQNWQFRNNISVAIKNTENILRTSNICRMNIHSAKKKMKDIIETPQLIVINEGMKEWMKGQTR